MSEGSKGNRKRTSALQKAHYASHPFKLAKNKLKRLKRHVKRNAYDRKRKARRGTITLFDKQAIWNLQEKTK